MDKIKWIYPCGADWKYCKDGFCGRYNQLKEAHKHPAVEMSKEWQEATGQEWESNAIRNAFNFLTVRKSNDCENDFEKFTKKIKSAFRLSKKIIENPEYLEHRNQLIEEVNYVLVTLVEKGGKNGNPSTMSDLQKTPIK